MTQAQLNRLLKRWKEKLYLQDWTIQVELMSAADMGDDPPVGQVRWHQHEKSAVVNIMREEDIRPNSLIVGDQEYTLVHELLHLHFIPLGEQKGPKRVALEQAVNVIARALVDQTRRKKADLVRGKIEANSQRKY